MSDKVTYWYSLSWNDDANRMWVYPPSQFESSSEARKAHTSSLRGYWITSDMTNAHVSDLFVSNGSRLTAIADGGFVVRPAADKALPYRD